DVSIDGAMSAHYDYDANGNRIAITTPVGTINATYDAQDRLLTQGSVSYIYGPNGELATKTDGGQTTTYTYDALGAFRKVVSPAGKTIEYAHDGLRRRVTKKADGVAVQGFLYGNALHPVAELDGSGNVASRFIYGTRSHHPEVALRGGATYRLIQDQLGSTHL